MGIFESQSQIEHVTNCASDDDTTPWMLERFVLPNDLKFIMRQRINY